MAQPKAPLAERDANAAPKKSSGGKRTSKATAKEENNESPSLFDVANNITQTHGKKRPHEDDADNENDSPSTKVDASPKHDHNDDNANPALAEASSDSDPDLIPIKYSCNQLRSKMRALVNSGEMKVGELQRALDISQHSYSNFMKQSGPMGGSMSDTFPAAQLYFIKRDKKGLKIPAAKKAKTSNTKDTDKSKAKSNTKDEAEKWDVSSITLDKESSGSVPIFDTCDDLRTKLNAHLRRPGITQAGLGRTLAETYSISGDPSRKISGKQITDFLQKKGPRAGATSVVYYAAYVYFEKLRLKQKKEKSKKRQEMEDAHGPKGCPTDVDASRGMWIGPGEVPSEDKYGVVTIHKMPAGARAKRLPPSQRSVH